jgi:hypothetical protein
MHVLIDDDGLSAALMCEAEKRRIAWTVSLYKANQTAEKDDGIC